jgi:hypothetical protein
MHDLPRMSDSPDDDGGSEGAREQRRAAALGPPHTARKRALPRPLEDGWGGGGNPVEAGAAAGATASHGAAPDGAARRRKQRAPCPLAVARLHSSAPAKAASAAAAVLREGPVGNQVAGLRPCSLAPPAAGRGTPGNQPAALRPNEEAPAATEPQSLGCNITANPETHAAPDVQDSAASAGGGGGTEGDACTRGLLRLLRSHPSSVWGHALLSSYAQAWAQQQGFGAEELEAARAALAAAGALICAPMPSMPGVQLWHSAAWRCTTHAAMEEAVAELEAQAAQAEARQAAAAAEKAAASEAAAAKPEEEAQQAAASQQARERQELELDAQIAAALAQARAALALAQASRAAASGMEPGAAAEVLEQPPLLGLQESSETSLDENIAAALAQVTAALAQASQARGAAAAAAAVAAAPAPETGDASSADVALVLPIFRWAPLPEQLSGGVAPPGGPLLPPAAPGSLGQCGAR